MLDTWITAGRLPLVAVSEPQAGLSIARNAALRVARGRLIAFTDDDCLVAPDWLNALRDAFAALPAADAIGGLVGLHDERLGAGSPARSAEVRHGYLIGRGAYYGKHILRGDVVVLRQAAREIAAMMRARHPQGIRLLARGTWLRLANRQNPE